MSNGIDDNGEDDNDDDADGFILKQLAQTTFGSVTYGLQRE